MKRILNRFRSWITFGLAKEHDIKVLYAQIAGLQQIQSSMLGLPILKPMRGWAISPDAIGLILSRIQETEEPIIVEFGSGQSTIILGSAAKQKGGKFFSAERTRIPENYRKTSYCLQPRRYRNFYTCPDISIGRRFRSQKLQFRCP